MVYILFHLRTNRVGYDTDVLYEFQDNEVLNKDKTLDEEYLYEIGYELAADHAEFYGIESEDDGCEPEEPFSFTYERLEGTREELEEEWGCINKI